MDRLLGGLGAGVIRLLDSLDRLQNPILLLKVPPSLPSIGEALAHHRARLHPVEDVEEIVGVSAHQRSGQSNQLLGGSSQHAEAISLRGVSRKLMEFVSDGKVKPACHIAADVFDRRHALDAAPVRLPNRRESRRPLLRRGENLRDLQLVVEVEMGKLLALRVEDGKSGVRVDDASAIGA